MKLSLRSQTICWVQNVEMLELELSSFLILSSIFTAHSNFNFYVCKYWLLRSISFDIIIILFDIVVCIVKYSVARAGCTRFTMLQSAVSYLLMMIEFLWVAFFWLSWQPLLIINCPIHFTFVKQVTIALASHFKLRQNRLLLWKGDIYLKDIG